MIAQSMFNRLNSNWIPPSLPLYFVVSLHTELRDVRGVQECTCTWSTGVYVEYGECTLSTGLYKLVCGAQAFYELWHGVTSTRWWSVWCRWVTTTIHPYNHTSICNPVSVYIVLVKIITLRGLENLHSTTKTERKYIAKDHNWYFQYSQLKYPWWSHYAYIQLVHNSIMHKFSSRKAQMNKKAMHFNQRCHNKQEKD